MPTVKEGTPIRFKGEVGRIARFDTSGIARVEIPLTDEAGDPVMRARGPRNGKAKRPAFKTVRVDPDELVTIDDEGTMGLPGMILSDEERGAFKEATGNYPTPAGEVVALGMLQAVPG